MANAAKTLQDLTDYTHQLKRHTAGRLAFVLRLSVLEKEFQQGSYKRNIAAKLKKLIDFKGARSFSLPSSDLVMITKDASLDDIAEPMNAIHKLLRGSSVIASLNPEMGKSDRFTTWFTLETDYDAFSAYVAGLGAQSGQDDIADAQPDQGAEADYVGPGLKETIDAREIKLRKATGGQQRPITMSRRVRMLPIAPPVHEPTIRDLDPALLLKLTEALAKAELDSYVRKRRVVAQLPDTDAKTVMTHWYVPIQSILEGFLGETQLTPNRWFIRYLEDLLAERLLALQPDLSDRSGLGASLRVSSAACLSDIFTTFHNGLGDFSRRQVLLEFSVYDVLQAYSRFEAAHERVTGGDYRSIIADIDIRHLPWLRFEHLKADFLKISMPKGPISHWLKDDIRTMLPAVLKRIGVARVILTNADSRTQVQLGQELGISLFEGEAVT